MDSETLHSVPDDELVRRLGELVSQSRRVEADLVAHIGEVDERRLFARMAFPSMFAYCTEGLHLSEAEAYRRITVARAARKHSVLLAMLRDGRLHLSGAVTLLPVLTTENRDRLLARATHRSKRQIEELVAELSPRPDVPSRMRRIPDRRTGPPQTAALDVRPPGVLARQNPVPGTVDAFGMTGDGASRLDRAAESSPARGELCPDEVDRDSRAESHGPLLPPVIGSELVPGRVARPRSGVDPLSPGRYRVQFTASLQLKDKLERLRVLMRSEIPDGDLAAIIEKAVAEKLDRLEAKRFGKTVASRKPLSAASVAPTLRHVPAAVRRAVVERDEGRCRFVDAQGRRCSERHGLEYHHRRPFGMGGGHEPANVSLLCRQHNRYLAERDFGAVAIRRNVRPGG